MLLIREKAANEKHSLGKWWTEFQKNDENLRKALIDDLKEKNMQESPKIFGFSEELR